MILHRSLAKTVVLVAAIAACCLPAGLDAAPRSKNVKRPLAKKGRAAELPVIRMVKGDRILVGDKHYVVTDFTRIVVNGDKAGLRDIKRGMQASVSGGVKTYGQTRSETLYKATRIVARSDNQLAKKAAAANKKVAEQNKKANQAARRRRR